MEILIEFICVLFYAVALIAGVIIAVNGLVIIADKIGSRDDNGII